MLNIVSWQWKGPGHNISYKIACASKEDEKSWKQAHIILTPLNPTFV